VLSKAEVQQINSSLDIGVLFFSTVFEGQIARRVMAGIIALSIFGNLIVMTFTASRGKAT
jgi:hypothetical protein